MKMKNFKLYLLSISHPFITFALIERKHNVTAETIQYLRGDAQLSPRRRISISAEKQV